MFCHQNLVKLKNSLLEINAVWLGDCMEINKIQDLIGHPIAIYFDDGQKVVKHSGIFKDFNSEFVLILTKDKNEMIPISRLIRLESIAPAELESD